ncbi:MAG: ABC transporter ATP-binding protein/permease [Lachnospiraceae bacterium]|nr:ABC transporter ATP-binding protein/permease [Lachnospiraceae bacterium]
MKAYDEKTQTNMVKILFQNRRTSAIFLIFTLAVVIVAPFKSYIMQWLVDSGDLNRAFLSLGRGLIVVALSHVTEYVSRQTFVGMSAKAVEEIRCRIMRRQASQSMEEYLDGNTGSVLSGLTNDMRVIYDEFYTAIFNLCFWGGMLVVSYIMLFSISPVIALASVLMCAAVVMVPRLVAGRISEARAAYSADIASYTGRVSDLLRGFETLMASGSMQYFLTAHENAAASNRKKEYQLRHSMNTAGILTSLAVWGPNMVMLFICVILVFQGKLTIGYLITANSLLNFVISPCRMVVDAFLKIKSSRSVREKLEGMMEEKEASQDGEEQLTSFEEAELSDVRFTYPKAAQETLHGVGLKLFRGQKMALVGMSGSGKSTMIRLLYRYYGGYQGHVRVNGREAGSYTRESYYSHVAMIPQTPFIFNDTIYNNLCLYQDYSAKEVERAVKLSGLEAYVATQPQGLETMLTENGRNLSGGQAQRVAIARALIRGCGLLLVDEATSSLDVETTDQIMRNLVNLDCAVLVITHDIFGDYMKDFDRIVYLENGEVSEEGTFGELLEQNGGFAQLYQLMAGQDGQAG